MFLSLQHNTLFCMYFTDWKRWLHCIFCQESAHPWHRPVRLRRVQMRCV